MHNQRPQPGLEHLANVVGRAAGRQDLEASFVLATRDAAPRTETILSELGQFLEHNGWRAEVLVVDDGSCDDTARRAAALGQRFQNLQVLRHGSQRGFGEAMRTGTQVARGNQVFLSDVDEAIPLESLNRMRDCLRNSAPVVVASPLRDGPLLDRISDTAFHTIARMIMPVDKRHIRSSFRAFRRDGAKEIAKRSRIKTRSWSLEWLALAHKMHLSIEELAIQQSENDTLLSRREGRDSTRDALRDLIQIRKNFGSNTYARARKDHAGLFDTSFVVVDRAELARIRATARRRA